MFSKEIRERNSKRLRRIAFGDCLCAWQGQRQKGRTKSEQNHRENRKKTNQTRNHFDLPSALPSVPFALPFASPFALPFCFCLLIWMLICLLLWPFALHFALFCVLLGSSWDRSLHEKLAIGYFRHSSHTSYTSTQIRWSVGRTTNRLVMQTSGVARSTLDLTIGHSQIDAIPTKNALRSQGVGTKVTRPWHRHQKNETQWKHMRPASREDTPFTNHIYVCNMCFLEM